MDKDKKLKILQVHNYYQIPGGEDTVVANEKKLLEDHGHEVVQYSRNNSELKEFTKVRKLLLPFTTIFNPRTYTEVKQIIKKQNIDIVHVHNTLNLISPAVYYAALSCKVPVVQTVHNFRLLCPGATFYRDGHICEDCVSKGLICAVKHGCYRGSKAQTLVCVLSTWIHRMTGVYGKLNYICLTEFNKEKLLSLKQIKPEQIYIKPNFTYTFGDSKETGEYYLYIGRIEEIKGVSLLIEAFSKMSDKKLKLAGTGTELEKYQNLVKENNLTNISFEGFCQREKLSELLKNAKAVVVTSQCYETFGMIVVEAFSGHIPVIVGDIGNVGSLVDDGVDGIKFEYNSVASLCSAIEKFEKSDMIAMGENAYKKYLNEFEMNGNYEKMKVVYSKIIGGGYDEQVAELIFGSIVVPYENRPNQFIYVGRIDKLKGIDLLLKAWKLMGDNAPKLIVCGTGPMEDWCKEYIAENGLCNIEMRGFVPNNEAKKLIANSKALILPTQWYEGFPMTIVEAYSVGTPVIGSDLGNTGSLIKVGESGLKFDYRSPENLCSVISLFMKNEFVLPTDYVNKYDEKSSYRLLNQIYIEARGV